MKNKFFKLKKTAENRIISFQKSFFLFIVVRVLKKTSNCKIRKQSFNVIVIIN